VPVQRLSDGLGAVLEKHTATLAFPKAIASVSKGCPKDFPYRSGFSIIR